MALLAGCRIVQYFPVVKIYYGATVHVYDIQIAHTSTIVFINVFCFSFNHIAA